MFAGSAPKRLWSVWWRIALPQPILHFRDAGQKPLSGFSPGFERHCTGSPAAARRDSIGNQALVSRYTHKADAAQSRHKFGRKAAKKSSLNYNFMILLQYFLYRSFSGGKFLEEMAFLW
jgi:hypothetical protein